MLRLFVRLAAQMLTAALATPAMAEVELAFYARDGDGRTFPHAFVTMRGEVGPDHTTIDRSAGFTAVKVSMAIVAGPVPGAVYREPPVLIQRSKRHFAIRLSDDRYRKVSAAIHRWAAAPQPSYHLEQRNCVHFVAAIARAAGLRVPSTQSYWRDPQHFVAALKAANAGRPQTG